MLMVGNRILSREFLHWYYTHTEDETSTVFLRSDVDYEVHVTTLDAEKWVLTSKDVLVV